MGGTFGIAAQWRVCGQPCFQDTMWLALEVRHVHRLVSIELNLKGLLFIGTADLAKLEFRLSTSSTGSVDKTEV